MNKYIITVENSQANNAGPKAKADVEQFLTETDYQTLPLKVTLDPEDKSLGAKLKKIYYGKYYIPKMLQQSQADVILLQYPIYSAYLTNELFKAIKQKTKAKLYLLIHDIETLRLFGGDKAQSQAELALFKQADGIIAHNAKMRSWLEEQGVNVPIVDLGLFDYYNPTPLVEQRPFAKSVVFAGNLAKADFLKKAATLDFELTLFGPAPAKTYPEPLKYAGVYPPDELAKHFSQNFGLVWDGDSLLTCNGVFGEYMRYNDPHKVSLYLSSGLPVIMWKEAALADFIVMHNVGFVVESLTEVGDVLKQMTPEQYREMQQNTLALAQKLRQGHFIKTAVKKLDSLEG